MTKKEKEAMELENLQETAAEPMVEAVITPAAKEATIEVAGEQKKKRPAYNSVPQVKSLGALIDDGNDLIVADMPSINQQNEVAEFKRAIARKEIRYGKVFAVEVADDGAIRIALKIDTVKVIIPAEDFFAHSPMKDIEADTLEGRLSRYKRKASHMLGAVVSFIPMGLGVSASGVPFVIASRKAAMDKLQMVHFFGPNPDVKLGSIAKASIVSSGPRYVTVECLGKEVVIGTGGLSAFAYIEDASKEYKPGQGLVVAVEKLEVNPATKTADIQLSHALIERLEAKVEIANAGMINGRYLATVIAVTKEYYIVVINGMKIRGLVHKDKYRGENPLIAGKPVVMLVTGIDEVKNMVIGSCLEAN